MQARSAVDRLVGSQYYFLLQVCLPTYCQLSGMLHGPFGAGRERG